ncbi:hypothetical protein [Photobacterium sanguinicancri]|uniref:hypothetical protein n=1 Tax=Photobacterium sanguinicancri TaxID=875932 RepID=UPI0021C3F507|nr:hypothetical protein [Photobacterium sanguinicancri]
MDGLSSTSVVIMSLTTVGILGIFTWVVVVIYLKLKWLKYLEDVLDEGVRYYSLNIFLAGQGILQYGTVFLSTFHAQRYKMLKKRDKVSKGIQRLFIFAFSLFMLSTLCLFLGMAIHQFYV